MNLAISQFNPEHPPIESILTRKSLEIPPGFVTVYRAYDELSKNIIDEIDGSGLKVHSPNIPLQNVSLYQLWDKYRPTFISDRGISKLATHAYPLLNMGNGLRDASERWNHWDPRKIEFEYDINSRAGIFQIYGVNPSFDEFTRACSDPNSDLMRQMFPGDVIELAVDPQKCFVGDMEFASRISEDMHRGYSMEEAVKNQAPYYWGSIVLLSEFLKHYKFIEWDETGNNIKDLDQYMDTNHVYAQRFGLLKGAQEGLPILIDQPEVLIQDDVPQNLIRIVR